MPARLDKKLVRLAPSNPTPIARVQLQRRPAARDELSTGQGSALRRRALATTGAGIGARPVASSAPVFSVSQLQLRAPATAPVDPVEADVRLAAEQVEQAYAEGGAEAAARMLNSATIAFEPDVVARITEAARPTIDRIVDDLRATSHDADGDQASRDDRQLAFDTTVANLSAAVGRGRGAMLEHVTHRIAGIVDSDGLGRFDEALGNTVLGGPSYLGFEGTHILTDPSAMNTTADATLALGVIEQLNGSGKTGEADDILQNVDASLRAVNGAAERLSGAVNGFNAELAQLVNDWSPLMTDAQLDDAIAAFKDSHPEYAALESLAGGALRVQNQLADAPAGLAGLGHADDLADSIERATDLFPDLAGLTESGQAELAELLEGGDDGSGLLGQIASLAAARKKEAGYLQKVGNLLLNNTVATALQASAAGDLAAVRAAVQSLERQAGVFGLAPDRMRDITSNLEAAATASTQAAAEDALQRMDLSIQRAGQEGAFASTSGLGQAFRAAGVTLGAAATVGAVAVAVDDPSFSNVVGALAGAAGTADGAIALARGVTRNFELLKGTAGVLRNVGVAAGVITTGMSVFNAAQALERGDAAQASLFALQAAGGVAVLAGATGVGTVIALGAGLALAQLERVRASNRFENEHTEAFLQAAGLSADATNHLRDADDDGRSVGPVLAALAERMNVEPTELLQAVGELEPSRLSQLVEAMHAVDPNGEGEFRQTDETDAQAGTPFQPGTPVRPGEPLRPPRSLEGIVQFLANTGIELP
ncbi:MAG: hypothetical protein JNK82_42700 [Myxococcaceae bacterium]|nr:hypothetical protein [Myxococcaceae bacterium]